ncbi:collagen alpha-1(I) chain-like [Macrobrachium rosenbergii]|uniref:collagen alpha-1(I) chain-like n=1 Tax=Macrobrachium rosenbergii TaxID=79674 RepID=UPI0034D65171
MRNGSGRVSDQQLWLLAGSTRPATPTPVTRAKTSRRRIPGDANRLEEAGATSSWDWSPPDPPHHRTDRAKTSRRRHLETRTPGRATTTQLGATEVVTGHATSRPRQEDQPPTIGGRPRNAGKGKPSPTRHTTGSTTPAKRSHRRHLETPNWSGRVSDQQLGDRWPPPTRPHHPGRPPPRGEPTPGGTRNGRRGERPAVGDWLVAHRTRHTTDRDRRRQEGAADTWRRPTGGKGERTTVEGLLAVPRPAPQPTRPGRRPREAANTWRRRQLGRVSDQQLGCWLATDPPHSIDHDHQPRGAGQHLETLNGRKGKRPAVGDAGPTGPATPPTGPPRQDQPLTPGDATGKGDITSWGIGGRHRPGHTTDRTQAETSRRQHQETRAGRASDYIHPDVTDPTPPTRPAADQTPLTPGDAQQAGKGERPAVGGCWPLPPTRHTANRDRRPRGAADFLETATGGKGERSPVGGLVSTDPPHHRHRPGQEEALFHYQETRNGEGQRTSTSWGTGGRHRTRPQPTGRDKSDQTPVYTWRRQNGLGRASDQQLGAAGRPPTHHRPSPHWPRPARRHLDTPNGRKGERPAVGAAGPTDPPHHRYD